MVVSVSNAAINVEGTDGHHSGIVWYIKSEGHNNLFSWHFVFLTLCCGPIKVFIFI